MQRILKTYFEQDHLSGEVSTILRLVGDVVESETLVFFHNCDYTTTSRSVALSGLLATEQELQEIVQAHRETVDQVCPNGYSETSEGVDLLLKHGGI